jgi:hypothetical protein
VDWILGPAEKLLSSQTDIGDSYEAADELRKQHEQLELRCTVWAIGSKGLLVFSDISVGKCFPVCWLLTYNVTEIIMIYPTMHQLYSPSTYQPTMQSNQ